MSSKSSLIASFTWLLVPERIDDRDKKLLIKELLRWMLTTGQGYVG